MIFDKVNNKDKEAMTDIKKNLKIIKSRIEKIAVKFNRDPSEIKLIVVTKKFDFEKIKIPNNMELVLKKFGRLMKKITRKG